MRDRIPVRSTILLLVTLMTALTGAVGCGHSAARLVVRRSTDLLTHPLQLTVTGLDAGGRVTISARTHDMHGQVWSSAATFVAGSNGRVDLRTSKPVSGSYSAASAYGLLGTLTPARDGETAFAPPARGQVTLKVTAKGRVLAHTTVTRLASGPGVTVRRTTVHGEGFDGYLYLPRRSGAPKPAVLAFGGSEGGSGEGRSMARALAAEGYPALGIGYFKVPSLPNTLSRIPIEYFGRALRYLARQPGVDPRRIAVLGVSRGSEAAQLVGVHYPHLVHAVLPLVPANVSVCSYPGCKGAAWTWHGHAVPYTRDFNQPAPTDHPDAVIPGERIDGPVLVVCGGDDRIWSSCPYARAIVQRRHAHHSPYHDVLLDYPNAGHGVGLAIPGLAETFKSIAGHAPGSNAVAIGQLWPRLLTFLSDIPH